ncbi:hypothetical protein [Helicobacter sp. 11S02629-2]|nr:hypothetical protein [Helicobacter sp. 11S02629-2]
MEAFVNFIVAIISIIFIIFGVFYLLIMIAGSLVKDDPKEQDDPKD